jgi:four helix bundle protein
MAGTQSYRNLEIFVLAKDLAVKTHRMTLEELPKFELYETGSQIRRSSKSVVANIVEGFGRRRYKKEFLQFLTYALASCDETKVHLEILCETGSLANGTGSLLTNGYNELWAKLYNFRSCCEKPHGVLNV